MAQKFLSGRLAIITGGTGGIGRATCAALASQGCNIAVHYHRASDVAEDLIASLSGQGVEARAFQADLSDYEQARRLHKEVVSAMGHPDIVFLNAGINGGKVGVKDIGEVTIEEFEQTWRGNCGQAFLLAQLCIPALVEKGWGRLIFCSSVAGLTGGVVGPHYAYVLSHGRGEELRSWSSKSALHGLIHWLASAYAKQGVTVNGIAPALITETAMLPGSSEELEKKIPIGRLGKPDEIADTVLWMVKTGYVTNKVIAVDGGMAIQ